MQCNQSKGRVIILKKGKIEPMHSCLQDVPHMMGVGIRMAITTMRMTIRTMKNLKMKMSQRRLGMLTNDGEGGPRILLRARQED